jgi:hypothetical protein
MGKIKITRRWRLLIAIVIIGGVVSVLPGGADSWGGYDAICAWSPVSLVLAWLAAGMLYVVARWFATKPLRRGG